MKRRVRGRVGQTFAVALDLGVCVSATLLAVFGYQAIVAWRQSSILLAERHVMEAANRVVLALTRDMQAVQRSVLLAADREDFGNDLPYSAIHLAASTFARFPYPESFFAWRDVKDSDLGMPVFFNRRDRPPPWAPNDTSPNRFPVAVRSNEPVAHLLIKRIQADAAEGRHFSVFEMTLGDTPYQVVARLLHDDALHQHLDAVVGFTVNLTWARQFYFEDLTKQILKAEGGAAGLTLFVADDYDEVVVGTRPPTGNRPTSRRMFPLMFFDPLLLIAHSPADVPRHFWTVGTATSGDSALAAAMGGAGRLLILEGLAAATLVIGLVLSVRAARAGVKFSALRSDFISGVSHELKSPLATIRAAGEMLAAGRVREENDRRQYGGLVVQEAKRLGRLVDNLLAVSRVTDIATTYSFEPFAIDVFVQQTLQRLNLQLTDAQFTVHVDVPPELPPVMADRDALLLMLDNLIDNSMRHAGNDRRLEISARQAGPMVLLNVRDHGRGIPFDDIDRVTHKFYRGRNAGLGGTGLGLAIAKRIALDHGGTLTIQSAVDVGTTVTIGLPTAPDEDNAVDASSDHVRMAST